MSEDYFLEIKGYADGSSLVVVVDLETDLKLSGTTPSHLAIQMMGVLIEDHRERKWADPVDKYEIDAKAYRRGTVLPCAIRTFGDEAKAKLWLATPNSDFAGRRPMAVAAADDDGLAVVKAELEKLLANEVEPSRLSKP